MVKRKTIIGFILILIIIFSALIVLSASERFLYYEELTETTLLLENHPNGSGYIGNFTDANNITIARVQFFLQNAFTPLPSAEALLIINHADDIEVDSMVFKFESAAMGSIYLKSDPSNVQYSFNRELDGINFNVEDFRWLGKAGRGDAEFRFILHNVQKDRPNDLQLTIDLCFHLVAPIQLTGLRAHTTIDMIIPIGESAE